MLHKFEQSTCYLKGTCYTKSGDKTSFEQDQWHGFSKDGYSSSVYIPLENKIKYSSWYTDSSGNQVDIDDKYLTFDHNCKIYHEIIEEPSSSSYEYKVAASTVGYDELCKKVAEYALEHYGFEKIIFIPAFIPPHKEISSDLAKHRFEMVKIATAYEPRFEVSDIEYKLGADGKKSYSLNTVKKIKELYRIDGKINFLIGTDAFEKIESWYKADELSKLVHFIVFPRGVNLTPKVGFDYEMAQMPFIDVSSTDLRINHTKNHNLKKVEEYIKKNGLYN